MDGRRGMILMVAAMVAGLMFPGGSCVEEMHHVVGEDRGWDAASDVGAWATGKMFRVGDNLWFAYSATLESVVELRSREEFESCDLRNPLRMYTDGLDKVRLESEGSRFFVSGQSANCKKGLKLHVDVRSWDEQEKGNNKLMAELAEGPSPSAAVNLRTVSAVLPWLVLAAVWLFG
ncbi:umecyanin-like [Nymphaea colorata]|nr:umecyanin-like [Nymphaea colorata]